MNSRRGVSIKRWKKHYWLHRFGARRIILWTRLRSRRKAVRDPNELLRQETIRFYESKNKTKRESILSTPLTSTAVEHADASSYKDDNSIHSRQYVAPRPVKYAFSRFPHTADNIIIRLEFYDLHRETDDVVVECSTERAFVYDFDNVLLRRVHYN